MRFVAIAAMLLASAYASATAPVPSNAHPLQYRDGWECNRGYVKTDDTCVAMKVPANAYLAASGTRWDCERGFLKDSNRCVPVKVPAHDTLTIPPTKMVGNATGDTGRSRRHASLSLFRGTHTLSRGRSGAAGNAVEAIGMRRIRASKSRFPRTGTSLPPATIGNASAVTLGPRIAVPQW
jgi:hypothetical protein